MSSIGYSAELLRRIYGSGGAGGSGSYTGGPGGSGGSGAPANAYGNPPGASSDPFGQNESAWSPSANNQFRQRSANNAGSGYDQYTSFGGLTGGIGAGQSNPYQNAGSRTVGSTDWNAVANLGNFLDLNPDQYGQALQRGLVPNENGAPHGFSITASNAYLAGTGSGAGTPSGFYVAGPNGTRRLVNGTYEDAQRAANEMARQYGGLGGSGGGAGLGTFRPNATDLQNPSVIAMMTPAERAQYGVAGGVGGAGGTGGPGAGSGGGMGAGVPRTGLPLEGLSEEAYARLIRNGGSILSPEQVAGERNRSTDVINRSTQDQINAARADAARRGVSSESMPDLEARIRARGAEGASRAGAEFDLGLQRDDSERLMRALGGSTGLMDTQLGNIKSLRDLRLLAAQVAQGNSPFTYLVNH